MKKSREVYISVDIEAAGPFPPDYSMLSLGACLIDNTKETFYKELKPLNHNHIPEALKVTGLNLKHLEKEGSTPKNAMIDFQNWVNSVSQEKTPVMVGFNASFDWSFINYYSRKFLLDNVLGIGSIDIKSYICGKLGLDWTQTKNSQLEKILGLKFKNQHNALADAIEQAEIFKYVKNAEKNLILPTYIP